MWQCQPPERKDKLQFLHTQIAQNFMYVSHHLPAMHSMDILTTGMTDGLHCILAAPNEHYKCKSNNMAHKFLFILHICEMKAI